MSLDNFRKQIDEMDARIVKLIGERIQITRNIGKEKMETGRSIEDKSREKVVLERVKNLARLENLNPDEVEKIYQRIILASKEVQGITASFQGEIGAYSEEAAFQ